MPKARIITDVDKDGVPTVSVQGVKGSGCTQLTKGLIKALGTVVEATFTDEYHQCAETVEEQEREQQTD